MRHYPYILGLIAAATITAQAQLLPKKDDFKILVKESGLAIIQIPMAQYPLHLVELTWRGKIEKDYECGATLNYPKSSTKNSKNFARFEPTSILKRKDGSILVGGNYVDEILISARPKGPRTFTRTVSTIKTMVVLAFKPDGTVDPSFAKGEMVPLFFPASIPFNSETDYIQTLSSMKRVNDTQILVNGRVGEREMEVLLQANGEIDKKHGIEGFIVEPIRFK